jgi:hypothetical protein
VQAPGSSKQLRNHKRAAAAGGSSSCQRCENPSKAMDVEAEMQQHQALLWWPATAAAGAGGNPGSMPSGGCGSRGAGVRRNLPAAAAAAAAARLSTSVQDDGHGFVLYCLSHSCLQLLLGCVFLSTCSSCYCSVQQRLGSAFLVNALQQHQRGAMLCCAGTSSSSSSSSMQILSVPLCLKALAQGEPYAAPPPFAAVQCYCCSSIFVEVLCVFLCTVVYILYIAQTVKK